MRDDGGPRHARGGSHVHKENTFFFCNPRCRERFAADPEKYLDPAYKPGGMSGMAQLGAPAAKAAAPAGAVATPATDKPVTDGSRSKDPVCGMMVDPATARGGSHVHKENTYFFCNPRCRERFAAGPEKYLDPAYKPGGMSGMVQLGGIAPAAKAAAPAAVVATPAPYKPAASASSTATKPAGAPPGIYTCPMDPEVRQDGPGICPVCGMALEPETIELPTAKTEYVCPMHPEVVRDEPGDCPICGMALEARSVSAAAAGKPGTPRHEPSV